MASVNIDFGNRIGKMKPMHATNNGPAYKFGDTMRITNIDAFREAGIPYARNHDASFCAAYGGEHTVDVHAIFPDFDAEVDDPDSYDFAVTDEYVRVCEYAGVRTFYRLGTKIEHEIKKYHTLPPKDFQRWARICEHIIRHYTEGWANGFCYDIEYWEIWNEADGADDDAPDKTTWGGTKAQFFEFYRVVATHLKGCFPHLKIGGPSNSGRFRIAKEFIEQLDAPLDFFSWHRYLSDPHAVMDFAQRVRTVLDENGFEKTESILNEWNYVRSFSGEDWLYSLHMERGIKGAAYVAAMMAECQRGPVDMLMYYDARPNSTMNGMFSDIVTDKRKGYYPFLMFNSLYRLGSCVQSTSDTPSLYVCAAANDTEAAILLTHFNDDDATPPLPITLDWSGFVCNEGVEAEWYLLDAEHDLISVNKMELFGNRLTWKPTLPNFTSYLIKLRKKGN